MKRQGILGLDKRGGMSKQTLASCFAKTKQEMRPAGFSGRK